MALADGVNRAIRRVPAWPIYIVGAALPVWLFWQGATGGLGVDPVKAIEHRLGLWGLKLIVAGLCITPLRRFAGVNLIKYRRAIGLLAFFYILSHLLAWIVLDMGLLWAQALGDIVKRPYITMGMAGFLAMIPLALTSNDRSVRRLGAARWRVLHRLTYVAALAGAAHYLWLVKAWPWQPILYLAAVVALLGLRLIPKNRATRAPNPVSLS
ncbi:protein-methionine-sulfoxide reductase heme-binding subunit MsrQ [Defluviimonas sp. SAOS-178_SWC]|uniref:protein-methionine-sulfoxide reductase heme-binding subunit MsrQ n=1 Tax=Defluviimonas sp. SAOS-178_SWC TaxID=3121287 RepID=UPI0032214598